MSDNHFVQFILPAQTRQQSTYRVLFLTYSHVDVGVGGYIHSIYILLMCVYESYPIK